jgi:hypothetical protein
MNTNNVVFKNAYVSYFDILGFTSRFISGDLMHHYEDLITVVKEIKDTDLSILLFSDSIVIFSEHFGKVKNAAQAFYTWGILQDFWLRGAIAQGNVTKFDLGSFTHERKIILPFLGEGYLKAYKLESTLNISGIVIDDALFSSDESVRRQLATDTDYVEYEEYLPKRGYEGKKRLLLPTENSVRQIVDTMYFEEMLKSHIEDIDKYINTFCFFIKFLLDNAVRETVTAFLQKILGTLELQSQWVLIPSKVVIIFVVLVEGLLNRYRSGKHKDCSDPSLLELDISNIVRTLKEQGYLPAFIDYLLEYDKRRHTNLYRDINNLRSSRQNFA